MEPPQPLSGRRAQAARNDQSILEAARAVLTADPEAPIAAVAEQAGVGISALYRRYRSKEELLQRLATDGLQRYVDLAEAALADPDDTWQAFSRFMDACLDAGTSSLSLRFAGHFTPTEAINHLGSTAYTLTQRLLERTRAEGLLRADIEVGDISLLFEQLQSIHVRDEDRVRQLRRRYLALVLEGLRAPGAEPLPGPAPRWEEIRSRYDR